MKSRFHFHRAGVASYSIQKVKKEDMTNTKPEKAKIMKPIAVQTTGACACGVVE